MSGKAINLFDMDGSIWLEAKSKNISTIKVLSDEEFEFCGKLYHVSGREIADGIPNRMRAFYDHWKVAVLSKWNPLIYWAAFGSDKSFDMLKLGLESLCVFGRYQGDVLIITDRSRDELKPYIPEGIVARSHVFTRNCDNIGGYKLSRYALGEWGGARRYGPILYVDTDVIFDAPVEPILIDIALERQIVGQGDAGPLWRDMGVGAHILEMDGYSFSHGRQESQGFCSGTLGIPSMAEHADDLNLLHTAIEKYTEGKDHSELGWFDQPTANYVLYKLYGECPKTLVNYVRWGGKNAFHGGDRPLGLVHLWGGGDKLEEMKELLDMMTGYKQGSSDWVVYTWDNFGNGTIIDSPNFRISSSMPYINTRLILRAGD